MSAELTPHQTRLLERMNAERKELGLPLIPRYMPPAGTGNRQTVAQPTTKDEVTQ